jgi:hypothetical protein
MPRITPLLCLAALSTAACKADDTDTDPPGATWSDAFEPGEQGAMFGVWGSNPDDVYMVGGVVGAGSITHYDGTDWTPVAIPASPLLVWVYGFGPDDIWTVGEDGAVLHYDGTDWTPMDAGTDEDLWGVWGAAPDDLWIVGGGVSSDSPVLLHWDGAAFTQHELAEEENDRGAGSMFKVWGMDGRVFAVGGSGLIVEWNGTAWTQMSAGAEANEDFVSLWGSEATGIVAVGGRSSARVAELSDPGWTTFAPTGVPGLNAVTVSGDEVIVGGQFGYMATWNGTDLKREDAPDAAFDVHAMWADGAGTTYAACVRFTDPYEGAAWER